MLTHFLYSRKCRGIREDFFRIKRDILRRRPCPKHPALPLTGRAPELTRGHTRFPSESNDQLRSIGTTALIRDSGQRQIRIREKGFRPLNPKGLQHRQR